MNDIASKAAEIMSNKELSFERKLTLYKDALDTDFDHHIHLPRGDFDRERNASALFKMYGECPQALREQLVKRACMLNPKMEHYQTMWVKELAKLAPEEANARIDEAEELLSILPPSQIKSEHHTPFYRDFIGKKIVNKKVSEMQNFQPSVVDFNENKEGVLLAKDLQTYLDKTLQTQDNFRMFDRSEHLRRGNKAKTMLNSKIPVAEKAIALVKISMMTQNMTCFNQAITIANNLKEGRDTQRIVDTIQRMKELAETRPASNNFLTASRAYLEKIENN